MQTVPIPPVVQNIPGRQSKATNEIVFRAENIPALGLKLYMIGKNKEELDAPEPESEPELEFESEPVNSISNEVRECAYTRTAAREQKRFPSCFPSESFF